MSEHVIADAELLALIGRDSAEARTDLYLRMLYSPRYALAAQALAQSGDAGMPAATRAFLTTVSFERLRIEQAARTRNLAVALAAGCPTWSSFFDARERFRWISAFADSDAFWRARGRSLPECFALFLFERHSRAGDVLPADVARLDGVIAGLAAAPAAESPWQAVAQHESRVIDGKHGERLRSEWPLVRVGALADAATLRRATPASSHFVITVTVEPDRSLTVECVS